MHFETIERVITDTVPIGAFLVVFEPIYSNRCNSGAHDDCETHGCWDNEDFYISEVEASIVEVTKDNYLNYDIEKALKVEKLWEGDTHDLRSRIFESLLDATEHKDNTLKRFTNAMPWEVFVQTD